jgi:hypothetical protein
MSSWYDFHDLPAPSSWSAMVFTDDGYTQPSPFRYSVKVMQSPLVAALDGRPLIWVM